MGAGPGDPELITARGMSRLNICDAVVYDSLASDRLLALAPENAERIYVGKRAGRHSMKQEEISRLLVELGREGKRVVRLKGGDPFVFGRGGEEILALPGGGDPLRGDPGGDLRRGGSRQRRHPCDPPGGEPQLPRDDRAHPEGGGDPAPGFPGVCQIVRNADLPHGSGQPSPHCGGTFKGGEAGGHAGGGDRERHPAPGAVCAGNSGYHRGEGAGGGHRLSGHHRGGGDGGPGDEVHLPPALGRGFGCA